MESGVVWILEVTLPLRIGRNARYQLRTEPAGSWCAEGDLEGAARASAQRDERWVILDVYGKGGHIRSVPIPGWVKKVVDCWTTAAKVNDGRLFRCVSTTSTQGFSEVRRRLRTWETKNWAS